MGQLKGSTPWNKGLRTGKPGGRACLEGCVCDRHTNSGSREGHRCPDGCVCGRHKGPWLGKKMPESARQAMRDGRIGLESNFKGKTLSPKSREKISQSMLKQWASGQRHMTPWYSGPNNVEGQSLLLLKPLGFQFVGNRELVIGRCSPDFWDGEHRLIELYGDYWHRGQNPQDRIDFFAGHGYDCLIIWERDLKDTKAVQERIRIFVGEG